MKKETVGVLFWEILVPPLYFFDFLTGLLVVQVGSLLSVVFYFRGQRRDREIRAFLPPSDSSFDVQSVGHENGCVGSTDLT